MTHCHTISTAEDKTNLHKPASLRHQRNAMRQNDKLTIENLKTRGKKNYDTIQK